METLSKRSVALALAIFALPLTAGEGHEFFESKIRPLLAAHCHTGGALGSLRLDSREGVLKSGKSGVGRPDHRLCAMPRSSQSEYY